MNKITINRTPAQIYNELRRYGKYEFRMNDNTLVYTFDYGTFEKAYEVIFCDTIVAQIRELDLETAKYLKAVDALEFGNF